MNTNPPTPSLFLAPHPLNECTEVRVLVEKPKEGFTREELNAPSICIGTLTISDALKASELATENCEDAANDAIYEFVGRKLTAMLKAHELRLVGWISPVVRAWYEPGPPWTEFFPVRVEARNSSKRGLLIHV